VPRSTGSAAGSGIMWQGTVPREWATSVHLVRHDCHSGACGAPVRVCLYAASGRARRRVTGRECAAQVRVGGECGLLPGRRPRLRPAPASVSQARRPAVHTALSRRSSVPYINPDKHGARLGPDSRNVFIPIFHTYSRTKAQHICLIRCCRELITGS
jgi:hypothetical protein